MKEPTNVPVGAGRAEAPDGSGVEETMQSSVATDEAAAWEEVGVPVVAAEVTAEEADEEAADDAAEDATEEELLGLMTTVVGLTVEAERVVAGSVEAGRVVAGIVVEPITVLGMVVAGTVVAWSVVAGRVVALMVTVPVGRGTPG